MAKKQNNIIESPLFIGGVLGAFCLGFWIGWLLGIMFLTSMVP